MAMGMEVEKVTVAVTETVMATAMAMATGMAMATATAMATAMVTIATMTIAREMGIMHKVEGSGRSREATENQGRIAYDYLCSSTGGEHALSGRILEEFTYGT